jgi:hypothetical protein
VPVRGTQIKDRDASVHGPLCRAIRRLLCSEKPKYTRKKERKPVILRASSMPKHLEHFICSDLITTRVPFEGLHLNIAVEIQHLDF